MDDLDAELAAFEAEIKSIDVTQDNPSENLQEPINEGGNAVSAELQSRKKRKREANEIGDKVAVVAAASARPTINKRYLQSMVNVYESVHEKVEQSGENKTAAYTAASSSVQKQSSQNQSFSMFPPTFSHSEAKEYMHQQSAYDYEKTQQRRKKEEELGKINERSANATGARAGPQLQSQAQENDKSKKFIREIGGEVWEDKSLQNWPDNDYRIFVGNLGKEINQEHLHAAFKIYPSYNMCRVVQNKASRQSKGYGFVSFGDPKDMLRAIREKNGAYLGHRPMKIKRGKWEERDIKHVRNRKKMEKRERRTR